MRPCLLRGREEHQHVVSAAEVALTWCANPGWSIAGRPPLRMVQHFNRFLIASVSKTCWLKGRHLDMKSQSLFLLPCLGAR